MKQFITTILFVALFAMSCTQQKNTDNSQANDSIPGTMQTEKLCYVGNVNMDSVKLEIQRTGNDFNGLLFYKRYRSDGSLGEYVGTISGDTLKGVYDFMSEGVISKIDKYFLMRGGKLLEGTGPVSQADDITFVFDDPSKVTFGKSFTLSAVDCSTELIAQKDKDMYYNLKK